MIISYEEIFGENVKNQKVVLERFRRNLEKRIPHGIPYEVDPLYGLWVMGLNARSLALCAWLAWRKPNHRLPIPAFKVGKTDYLTVEYAVEQNQNTGYKNILIL